ncbi:ribosome maturation factor RimP [Cellulomonas chengniuliangii]|uniref:ribosome maturation factor RimP n=1 Tax=Cellulomonas chengniuliangii TaxID=2968084 RepID=UPI001D0E7B20|nr:ribosome maturation factor RimP [Cellulomonas chengniuliangii]MCC2319228.1 ribosome maturation factor RimP [Cellulomonas chengniuliangii]MCC2319277.1 ribosome maturation factor RimP [Cellulomonas chengniuliangii]
MPAPATAQRVRDVVEPLVSAAGLVLEDVEVVRAGKSSVVRILVDLEEDAVGGLDLEDVAEVSQAISTALDDAAVVGGEHTLEVSSPGVGRALTERRHFTRARGRMMTLTRTDGSPLRGRLDDVDRTAPDAAVLVLTPETPGVKGRPPRVGTPVRVPLAEVRDGRVEVEMGRLAEVSDDEDDDAQDATSAGQES